MKGVRGLLTIACLLLAAAPAAAGTLYRCDGADGARSYVSKRAAGAKCVVVARSSPAPKRRSTPASVIAKIGRAHASTLVTTAHRVCRLMIATKNHRFEACR